MPRGDGTGPLGMGAVTGRGTGFCTGYKMPGYMNTKVRTSMLLGQGRGCKRMLLLAGVLPGCAYLTYKLFKRNRI